MKNEEYPTNEEILEQVLKYNDKIQGIIDSLSEAQDTMPQRLIDGFTDAINACKKNRDLIRTKIGEKYVDLLNEKKGE